ncbi:DUF2953 domain-containing protein [Terribacillus saccharophilus]|uniref:DUF2953 domain-containing protein n=1 Tax=Terribacillus saccharophilus TaxID=361277 RepID=UPI003981F7E9
MMWIIGIGIAAIALVIVMVLFAKVTVLIRYDTPDWNIQIRIFGICVHNRQMKQDSSIDSASASAKEIREQVTGFLDDLQKIRQAFPYLLRLGKNAEVDQFSWHTTIGMSDAASTGTMIGFIWTLKGIANQVIRSNFQSRQPFDIQVEPVFHTSFFRTSFQCIVSIRTGKAMQAIISNARSR